MRRSGRRPGRPARAASSGRKLATSSGWLRKACLSPSAVACSAKRWQARPAKIQFSGLALADTKIARPADESICFRHLPFSDAVLKNQSNIVGATQLGPMGLPLSGENRPSPLAMASRGLNLSQDFSSRTNARSAIWAVLAARIRSRTLSIWARSVTNTTSTPASFAASANKFRSDAPTCLPS